MMTNNSAKKHPRSRSLNACRPPPPHPAAAADQNSRRAAVSARPPPSAARRTGRCRSCQTQSRAPGAGSARRRSAPLSPSPPSPRAPRPPAGPRPGGPGRWASSTPGWGWEGGGRAVKTQGAGKAPPVPAPAVLASGRDRQTPFTLILVQCPRLPTPNKALSPPASAPPPHLLALERPQRLLHHQHLVLLIDHKRAHADLVRRVGRQRARRAARQPARHHHVVRLGVVELEAAGAGRGRRADERGFGEGDLQPKPFLALGFPGLGWAQREARGLVCGAVRVRRGEGVSLLCALTNPPARCAVVRPQRHRRPWGAHRHQ